MVVWANRQDLRRTRAGARSILSGIRKFSLAGVSVDSPREHAGVSPVFRRHAQNFCLAFHRQLLGNPPEILWRFAGHLSGVSVGISLESHRHLSGISSAFCWTFARRLSGILFRNCRHFLSKTSGKLRRKSPAFPVRKAGHFVWKVHFIFQPGKAAFVLKTFVVPRWKSPGSPSHFVAGKSHFRFENFSSRWCGSVYGRPC